MEEQQWSQAPTWQAIKSAVGALGVEELINLIAHASTGTLASRSMAEMVIFGGIAAAAAGYHAPEWLRKLQGYLPHTEELEPFWFLTHREPGKRSILDKLLDHYPDDEVIGNNDEPEDGIQQSHVGEWDESWYDSGDDDDDLAGPNIGRKNIFTFSSVLTDGFTPSLSAIYLGRLADGTAITVAAKDLCHVALPGTTGHGKSSLIRLLMAQLCYCGLPVYLLNPHYMVFDREHNEDWTPFTFYLKADPYACRETANIRTVLNWMTNTLLVQRKERAAKGGRIGKPHFFILDEVPDIVASIDGASRMIGKLLREGRKYGIFLIVASQDFSVKTLGIEGEGSIRKCFHTVLYVGGDPISVRELLGIKGKQASQLVIDEHRLGQGNIIARCKALPDPAPAETPYADNEALYEVLGPTTFVGSDDGSDDNDRYGRNGESDDVPFEHKQPENTPLRYGRNGGTESAPEETVSTKNDAVTPLPPGWTQKQVEMLGGFYLVFESLDDALKALQFSTSQRNRDFARNQLKAQGLWKEAR